MEALVDTIGYDSGTKCKKENVRCVIRNDQDQYDFTGGIEERYQYGKALWIEFMMRPTSHSTKSIIKMKYAATVVVQSLIKRKEGNKERMAKKWRK